MLKNKILTAGLFLITTLTFSQSVYVGKHDEISHTSLDSANNAIFVFFKDYYKKIDLETFEIDSVKIVVDPQFEFMGCKPVLVNSNYYFVHTQGGIVYKLQNDTIVRVDNSFNHKMQINSSIFVYDDKIVRYGGYGFWSARNFFTYFDTDLLEWETISPVNSKEVPKGTFDGLYILDHDNAYIFNGKSIDDFNKTEMYFNNEVWKYNLKLNEWRYLGTSELIDLTHFPHPIRYKKSLLVLYTNGISIIDLGNNKYIKFKHGKYSHNVIASLNHYFLNDRFYFFFYSKEDNNNEVYLKSASENEFIGEFISDKPFYSNYNLLKGSFSLVAGLLFTALLANFGFKQFKKRKKIVLLDNGLRHQNKFIEFDQKAMEILRLLASGTAVSSNKILSLVEEKQYSAAHNERIKVQKLEEINLKIKTLLSFNGDIIQSKKSEEDKRIRQYFINKNLFFLSKKDLLK
ncbi:MAG: hypothetical protein A3F91_08940 [Flavobacteria bacterium RIFCSPLOWO2_12_FULL_35_11]|nr:MAG: hypothetical protein A3F91_08940 [Flavobacteria bacterium RIFCSPLOWO2_12_FULL_35_11]